MTSSVRNRIMRGLAIVAMLCVGIVVIFAIKPANAKQTIAGENEFSVQTEAGVYIGENLSGIAFKTDVEKSYYESIKTDTNRVEFFTIVTAEKMLGGNDVTSLTIETAEELNAYIIKTADTISFANSNVWTYKVAITFEDAGLSAEQLEKAYQTKLVARSYLKIIEDDSESVVYANALGNSSSIREVAGANLKEAIEGEAVLTAVNVEKLINYAGKKDVNAFYDVAGEVEFIEQNLNGASVYVVNSKADGFVGLGEIQNGKLISSSITLSETVGEKTQVVIVDEDKAFVTDLTQVSKIIRSANDFAEIFWTPSYHVSVTHSITYNGKTYTETFTDTDNPEMLYRTDGRVYLNLSDDFVNMLADGATRNADVQTVTADAVNGYYVLANNIGDLGTNASTYCYNFSLGVVTEEKVNEGAIADTTKWGTDKYDNAGYRYAGNSAYLRMQEFTGTFDGLGHCINGFVSNTIGGLFGTLNNVTIKNVAFTGVESGVNGVNTGIIAYQNKGEDTLIENAYIKINSVPTGSNNNKWGAIYYNNHYKDTKSSTIKDVVIEMPTKVWDTNDKFGAGIIGPSVVGGSVANPITINVVAVTGTDFVSGYGQNYRVWVAENDGSLIADNGKYASFNSKNIQYGLMRYDDMDSAIQNNAFANFTADCWKTNLDGSIGFKSIPEALDGIHIYSEEESKVPETLISQIGEDVSSITDLDGNELLTKEGLFIKSDNTVDDMPIIVTTESGKKYTATFNVYTKIIYTAEEFTEIFLTPQYSYFETTHRIDTDGDFTTVEYSETVNSTDNPELVYVYTIEGKEDECISKYYSTLSLSEEAKKLIENGGTRLVNTNSVVKATPVTGSYALGADIEGLTSTAVTSVEQGRTGRAWAAPYNKNLETAATLKSAVAYNTDSMGYSFNVASNYQYTQTFSGTFDGMGHTISNVNIYSRGALFGTVEEAIIKNVAIVNVSLADSNEAVVAYSIESADSVIENVYIEVDEMKQTVGQGGVVYEVHGSAKGWTLRDAVVVTPATTYASGYTSGPLGCTSASSSNVPTIDNVIFITESPWIIRNSAKRAYIATGDANVEGVATNIELAGAYRYDSLKALGLSGKDLSSFDRAYWQVSTGIPVWKALADTVTTDWRDEINESISLRVDGEVVEEIAFTDSDGNSKSFELYSELLELGFTEVFVDDERVVTYADGKIIKEGVGATKIVYKYEICGKEYSGTILVSVTQGSFLKGEGIPDESLGSDGDTYLDTSTNDVYNKENGEWILVGNMDGDISLRIDDGLVQDTTIYTVSSFMGNTYKNSITASVIKNAQTERAEIVILSNEELVSVNQETGVITAVSEGKVEIRIRYENNTNGLVFAEDMVLTIIKPVANYNELVDMFSALDGELPLTDIFGEEVTLVSAKNLTNTSNILTVNDNKVLGLTTMRTGATTARLELESEKARMIVDVRGYTMVIDEAKDFAVFNLATDTTVIDGYFYLNNDISYDSTAPVNKHPSGNVATAYFAGVFDGNGHKVTLGVANKGIFGRLGIGAVIKNTAFINTVFTSNSSDAVVLAYRAGGSSTGSTTITNCYFEQKDFRSAIKGNKTSIIAQTRGTWLLLDNLVFNVDMPDDISEVSYGAGLLFCNDGYWKSGTDYSALKYYLQLGITNCYVVGDFKYMTRYYDSNHYRSYYAENEGVANDGYESFTYLGINRYDTFEDLGNNNTSKWQYVNGEIVFVPETECFIPEASYRLFGRAQELGDSYKFQLPNSGIEFAFSGTNLQVKLQGAGNMDAKVRIYIDGDTDGDIVYLTRNVYTYTKTGLADGNHTVRIINAYEEGTGFELVDVTVDKFISIDKSDKLRIQILGDSITTGYGSTKNTGGSEKHDIENSDSTLSYSYLVPLMLDADFSVVAKQGITVAQEGVTNMLHLYENYSLINSDIAKEEEFDVVIVNLGTNDASATTDEYRAKFPEYYKQLLTQIRYRNPNAKIVCVFNMMVRKNVEVIEAGIRQAVAEMNDTNIYCKLDFTAASSGHPSRQEHQANAEILVAYLKDLLNIA